MAGRAAAIALPARRVGRVAPDHLRAARAERQVIDLAERDHLRRAALDRQRERAIVAKEWLSVCADEQDAAVGRPSAHHHVGAEPGHAARRAAFRGHHVHLGMLLVAADERDP